jgi:hypothetical protein
MFNTEQDGYQTGPTLETSQHKQPESPGLAAYGEQKITWAGIFCTLGAWSCLLVIGSQIAWGNQSTYVCSYYYALGYAVTMEDFYIVQPMMVLVATFFFPVGMRYAEVYGPKL